MLWLCLTYITVCQAGSKLTRLEPLKSIRSHYKQALKILYKRSFQYHHCAILGKYNMLSLENLMLYSDMRLIHKIIPNAAPPPLKKCVQPCCERMRIRNEGRATRPITRGDCSLSNRSTVFVQSAFPFRASKARSLSPVI